MTTIMRRNERSWAIELISRINAFASANDLLVKRAGGESTIAIGRGTRMFPDIVLYGDDEQRIVLQGWEIKMPDVPIEDEAFIRDAQRKAVALHLNSCLIWNFRYAVLYVSDGNNGFVKSRVWNATSHIHSREDVETYRRDWEHLADEIILEINGYFATGRLQRASFGDVVTKSAIAAIIQRNKDAVAAELRREAFRNSVVAAHIESWWSDIRTEYERDETDNYTAYAKTILLNWANRIIFAHLIKERQMGAVCIDELGPTVSPQQANAIFARITSRCDFCNVFSPVTYGDVLPVAAWQDLVELSCFLKSNGMRHLDQEALQHVLESSVAAGRREINGQYATPTALAAILLRLTVRDWSDTILDCCCGTGTIPKAAIQLKKAGQSAREAVESVWACDKYAYPLQVANISMVDADTINIASRLFQHNALTLSVGEEVSIVNPESGETMRLPLPQFGAVVSNLPFVPFEMIPPDDAACIAQTDFASDLDGRSDLYCHLAVKLADIIKPGGRLGIIVSNSWLGTLAGAKFMTALQRRYAIRQVHISGKGRWFRNADVVATLLVLEKNSDTATSSDTDFWLWKKSLEELAGDADAERTLVSSAILGREPDAAVATCASYSAQQMEDLLSLKVCRNALFHHVEWLLDVREKLVPVNACFHVFRGSRRGWDALFYPKPGEHAIEDAYLKNVLKNARNVSRLMASADDDAFCCAVSQEELQRRGHTGALEWIARFADQTNGTGRPLPEVLQQRGMQWYELQDTEIAEIFTTMNPDGRLFFARFETPSFINQRLIGLRHKDSFPDNDLNHALLNSLLTLFYIEAVGFGRGLGALDINKAAISHCQMLDPRLVSASDRETILAAFERVKARRILKTADELRDEARLAFEHAVLGCFGLDGYFDRIAHSLLSLQATRAAARN